MIPLLEQMDAVGYDSMEMWGGATFDVAVRFLKDDPWERVRTFEKIRKENPIKNGTPRPEPGWLQSISR